MARSHSSAGRATLNSRGMMDTSPARRDVDPQDINARLSRGHNRALISTALKLRLPVGVSSLSFVGNCHV